MVTLEQGIIMFVINLEVMISIISCVIAIFLFALSSLAYRKEKRSRLLFVMIAFFLFAIKGILFSIIEVFFETEMSLEWIALTLDFGILIMFFVGLIKK